ncbi:hypothetical protein P7C71_g377, partial [Lecanoromycetidae sp. Uapishka_2]
MSSDRDRTPSIAGASSLLYPPSIRPEPAYIASSAASQIVNSDLADRDESYDSSGRRAELDAAIVSPASLVLLNAFLDQLLYSFLASSRSTSIAALRPAIREILKPRLGKEAIDGADEELQGYLAGGDAEELLAFHGGQDFKGEYNLNLVWRRTRLRCMVYTRLGDMEEEDEEMYLEQELEENGSESRPRLTRDLGEISPAAAIFLTSIIEFIGENALLVAAEAAHNRFQIKKSNSDRPRAMVEEVDMEKIAFNTTLGRLWRSWKKRVRTSSLLSPRPMSRELQRHKSRSWSGGDSSRKNSVSEDGYFGSARRPSVAEILHEDRELPPPEAVALPQEPDFDDESLADNVDTSAEAVTQTKRDRPHSMIEFPRQLLESNMPTPTQASIPMLSSVPRTGEERPAPKHMRSSSLPTKQTPYVSPIDETFTTPNEGPDPFVREDDRANAEKEMPRLTDDSRKVPGHDNGDHAVSTMYDGTIGQGDEVLPKGMAERTNRGISTYTESSNTDEYDDAATPQGPNPGRTNENIAPEVPGSRSSVSTDYSFHVGEQYPIAPSGGVAQIPVSRETIIEDEEGTYPNRADSLDQPGSDSETGRQHIGNIANLATLQEQQLRTYDDSGKAVKRDIPVLYEAPSNEDVIYNPDASVRSSAVHEDEEVMTPTRADPRAAVPYQGVPPLTPLRELIDSAHDTSDEASSIAPSYGTPGSEMFVPAHPSQNFDSQRIPSYNSSNFTNTQPSTSTSKVADLRNQPPTINTGAERAAVQRVSPSTTSPLMTTGRTSASNNRDGRPATSGSTGSHVSSKVKGIIGRESGDMIRQPMAHRTSSAGSGSLINGQLRTPKSADKEMDFEALIKSDETVKYTLTPQSMHFIRSTGPEAAPGSMAKSAVSSATKQSRPGSSSSPKPPPKKITKASPATTPKGSVSIPPKPEVMLPKRTTSKLQAREATVTNNNATADLAEFLRSGPAGAQIDSPSQLKKPGIVTRPSAASNSLSNGRLKEAVNSGSSVASTQGSFAPSKMTQSSTNSRTGLIENSNRAPPIAPAVRSNSRQRSQIDDGPNPGPVRNQRRVKDPYALESDSEDDGYGTAQPPEREEESLSDFLRNYNPPPTTNTRNVPAVQTTAPQPKKQKTTIRERMARNIAVIPDYRPLPPKAPKKNPSKSPPQSNESRRSAKRTNSGGYQPPNQNNVIRGRSANSVPQLPPINPRVASPHLVSQNGTKLDTYKPTQPTYAKHVDRRPRQHLQAREEHGSLSGPPAGGGMGDLADFLRETEPPPPSGPIGGGRPMSPMKEKEESAFGRMFSRRKKEVR